MHGLGAWNIPVFVFWCGFWSQASFVFHAPICHDRLMEIHVALRSGTGANIDLLISAALSNEEPS
jgi:hypothetical protein